MGTAMKAEETSRTSQATPATEPSEARDLVPIPREPGPPALVDAAPGTQRGGRRLAVILAVLLLAAGAAGGGWYWWQRQQAAALPPGIASGNGRIEAEQVDVATKVAGRVEAVLVHEGDMVHAGQVLARMDTREVEAALRQAEAQERQARRVLEARRAASAQQRSQLTLAQAELDRTRSLVQGGYATRQSLDQRVSTRDSAVAALNAATAQIEEAEQAIQAAEEAAERVRTQIADSTLVAPLDGRVQYRLAQPGEVLGAGGRVLTLLDVTDVYMAVFLPTGEAGRLPIGTEARIVLDALPEFVIPAAVTFVSPQAQFTPRQVETRGERERLMFRVKLGIDRELLRRHAEEVRTGLPGVGYVRLDAATPWPAWLEPGRRTAR
jgi:HlyD family secretion protein